MVGKILYILIVASCIAGILGEYLRRKREKIQRENERRINELFELREEAQHQFAQAVDIDPNRLTSNIEEQKMIERIHKAIDRNMANTEYTVDQLACDIGMSRAKSLSATEERNGASSVTLAIRRILAFTIIPCRSRN